MFVLLFLLSLSRAQDCRLRSPVYLASGPVNANNRYYVYTTPTTEANICQANVPALTFTASSHLGAGACPATSLGCAAGLTCVNTSLCVNCACYEEGYIIPLVNNLTGLVGCNLNVFSNMAMMSPWWNELLGAVNDSLIYERQEVFGALFTQAYNQTYKCCWGNYPATIPTLACSASGPITITISNSASPLAADAWAVWAALMGALLLT